MEFGQDSTTICALSTPNGMGAIALIRISGSKAIAIVEPLFSKKLTDKHSHSVVFGNLFNPNGDLLDEVVLTLFHQGKSFTGEETVEIACHGSIFIQQQIIASLLAGGCRMADPGEFTFRAYMNGKMDLSQAEAIADLIASKSEQAHKIALSQLRGGFSRELQTLREKLIYFASLVELELDFGEEDVEFANRDDLKSFVHELLSAIVALKSSFALGNAIKNGVPVAIVGAPNVGKSTLLNVLLNDDRAIVSEIAGTTRDSIEDETIINGIVFRFIDTAGLRKTDDVIEQMGIERSYEKAKNARIVIYVLDDNTLNSAIHELTSFRDNYLNADQTLLVVINKIDKIGEIHSELNSFNPICIAAKEKVNIDELKKSITSTVQLHGVGEEGVVVSNSRHLEALTHTQLALDRVVHALQTGITGDFIAMDIRQATHHLASITGEISHENILDSIFSNFCIGK